MIQVGGELGQMTHDERSGEGKGDERGDTPTTSGNIVGSLISCIPDIKNSIAVFLFTVRSK